MPRAVGSLVALLKSMSILVSMSPRVWMLVAIVRPVTDDSATTLTTRTGHMKIRIDDPRLRRKVVWD